MGEMLNANGIEIWAEREGQGPDVLLIAGLGDPAEAWQPQIDGLFRQVPDHRVRQPWGGSHSAARGRSRSTSWLTTPPRCCARRSTLEVPAAHELALNHPDVVRSLVLVSTWARPDAYFATMVDHWHWLADVAPSERAMLEAFFLWIYTPRAHADGTVDQIIERHWPSPTRSPPRRSRVSPRGSERTTPSIACPTSRRRHSCWPASSTSPPHPGSDAFNARVDAFWREVENQG